MSNGDFQPVSIALCKDYDPERVESALRRCLEPLGGMSSFVRPGQRVLIKPNLLNGKPADQGVCTHPSLVRAVARQALDIGAEVLIGDSPGMERLEKVCSNVGLDAIAEELGAGFLPFTHSVVPPGVQQRKFKDLELAREAFEVDCIINLPKCKTHILMALSLAVKNMFGCVIGKRKSRWHLQTDHNLEAFARLMLEIYSCLPPSLNILDAVVSMEGEGPNDGNLHRTCFLAACENGLHLDYLICNLLGVESRQVPILKVALDEGLLPKGDGLPEILGDKPRDRDLSGFILPQNYQAGLLRSFCRGIAEQLVTAKPAINPDRCISCGSCEEVCPVNAIDLQKPKDQIDYSRCIRCFCCQEVCPAKAVEVKHGLLYQLLEK